MTKRHVAGVLLAGGLSRRMGGQDKGLRILGGRPLLARVAERARLQVSALLLSGDDRTEGEAGLGPDLIDAVAADALGGRLGPLAGILTGLEWAREHHPDVTWVASFPTDAPFFPDDLVARLSAGGKENTEVVCARSGGRLHPVFALWRIDLATALRQALESDGERRAGRWAAGRRMVAVDFETEPLDPFFNINRPEDLAEAERLLSLQA